MSLLVHLIVGEMVMPVLEGCYDIQDWFLDQSGRFAKLQRGTSSPGASWRAPPAGSVDLRSAFFQAHHSRSTHPNSCLRFS